MSEKTHQPSAKKLRDAQRQGKVPKSHLLTSGAVTVGGLLGTLAFADETAGRLRGWTTELLSLASDPVAALYGGLRLLARSAAPTIAGALAAAVTTQLALTGFRVNAEHLSLRLDRLDPLEGAKKLVSLQRVIELGKGLLVATVVGLVLWRGVVELAPLALRAVALEGGAALTGLLLLWKPVLVRAGVALLLLGLGDQVLAGRRHRRDLMMSHEEVQQEYKDSEGDPRQKRRRRALHQQLPGRGAARGVHDATAVVVNPTHVAVALRYDEAECEAPYIVAKGREEDALNLRRAAASRGIPVVRDVALARALVHYDVGEEVPEELYRAAAAVLQVALEASASRDAVREVQSEETRR